MDYCNIADNYARHNYFVNKDSVIFGSLELSYIEMFLQSNPNNTVIEVVVIMY